MTATRSFITRSSVTTRFTIFGMIPSAFLLFALSGCGPEFGMNLFTKKGILDYNADFTVTEEQLMSMKPAIDTTSLAGVWMLVRDGKFRSQSMRDSNYTSPQPQKNEVGPKEIYWHDQTESREFFTITAQPEPGAYIRHSCENHLDDYYYNHYHSVPEKPLAIAVINPEIDGVADAAIDGVVDPAIGMVEPAAAPPRDPLIRSDRSDEIIVVDQTVNFLSYTVRRSNAANKAEYLPLRGTLISPSEIIFPSEITTRISEWTHSFDIVTEEDAARTGLPIGEVATNTTLDSKIFSGTTRAIKISNNPTAGIGKLTVNGVEKALNCFSSTKTTDPSTDPVMQQFGYTSLAISARTDTDTIAMQSSDFSTDSEPSQELSLLAPLLPEATSGTPMEFTIASEVEGMDDLQVQHFMNMDMTTAAALLLTPIAQELLKGIITMMGKEEAPGIVTINNFSWGSNKVDLAFEASDGFFNDTASGALNGSISIDFTQQQPLIQ